MLFSVRTKSRVGVLNLAYMSELLGDQKQTQEKPKRNVTILRSFSKQTESKSLRCGLHINMFLSVLLMGSPADSNMQPRLTTSGLGQVCLKNLPCAALMTQLKLHVSSTRPTTEPISDYVVLASCPGY